MRYSIEVSMTPATHDNPKEPYFWWIKVQHGRSCGNGGHGWAATTEEAWSQALEYYNRYYKED